MIIKKIFSLSRAGNSLIRSLLISLTSNERRWVIRSDRSRQMSNCGQIAQVAQDKWATVSKMTNEWLWAKTILGKKSNILFFVCFIYVFFYLKNEGFAHFLFFGEQCEQIAQVAHQKWAMWANRSGRSPKMSDHEQIAQVAHQKWANRSFFWAKHSFT